MMTLMRSETGPDAFGTARLRGTVLEAWSASPARFREDANAEEELARGAYRDRVVVELAQNASDAAQRAGLQGRLLLTLDRWTLRAANTGAPLDCPGVEGLSTLRASAKRGEQAVGRFGVGFAAVLAVTDEPSVISSTGGVRWSRAEAAAAVAEVPELQAELARRGTSVPVLRLPLPTRGDVPDGYETVVAAPLRDTAARELVRRLLDGVDDALLLALPGLSEITVEVDGERRVLAANRQRREVEVSEGERTTRWRVAQRGGRVPGELLADRPAEEPDRWSVLLAVPLDDRGGPAPLPPSIPRVVHAPTPTDERTDLPVLVLATFPLDSTRRRVDAGPLTEWLAEEVGGAYAGLLVGLADRPDVLGLVPGPLPAGALDGMLRTAVLAALAAEPLIPPAAGPHDSGRLAPRDVVLVSGLRSAADPAALADHVAGLPDPSWWRAEPLRRLGAREIGLDEVVDRLGDPGLAPEQWHRLYAALDGADLESLATLPVPLTDGRTVRGARGVLVPTGDVDVETLAPLGLRICAPDAAHPLLYRLGAAEATPGAALRQPMVRSAVEAGDPAVSEPVLDLVATAGTTADELPWLADVLLPDATGEPAPAGELWLPGSPVLDLLDVDAAEYTVGDAALRRWGWDALRRVGARDGFAVLRVPDVALDDEAWHDLDDEAGWIDAVLSGLPKQQLPPVVAELLAVRDLDLVRDDAWPAALPLLASDPAARPALVEPAYVLLADGTRHSVPSYTAWWLRTHARLDGEPVGSRCAADAEPIVRTVLPPLPVSLDDGAVDALGLARTLGDLARDPGLLLDRLARPALDLAAEDLAAVYAALVAAGPDPAEVSPPPAVRVPDGFRTRLAPAGDVVVADGPHWLQLGLPAVLPGPPELARLLDVPVAADVHDPSPDPGGVETPVPEVARQVIPSAAAGPPASYVEHDDLVVAGRSVQWWVDRNGTVHAATSDGLARGIAWAAGRWDLRLVLAEALRDPDAVPALLAERAYGDQSGRTTL